MARIAKFFCECPHCGGAVEFPASDAGLSAPCPHCATEFELLPILETPDDPGVSHKGLIWAIVGIGIMLLALGLAIGALFYFRSNPNRSESQYPASVRPTIHAGLTGDLMGTGGR